MKEKLERAEEITKQAQQEKDSAQVPQRVIHSRDSYTSECGLDYLKLFCHVEHGTRSIAKAMQLFNVVHSSA